MQNAHSDTQPTYRERLTPSLWAFVAAAVVGPMAALVFAPLNGTVSLVVGVVVGIGLIVAMIAASPVVMVRDGWLFAGRARIDTRFTGTARTYTGEEARIARGPALERDSWHLIRGGIDAVMVLPIDDPDDPVPTWTISSRTPDRLAAAIQRGKERTR